MKQDKQLSTKKKNISELVLSKVNAFKNAGELVLPKDYSAENALKSAYLVLSETKNKAGQYALQHCSQESIANALLKMVVWGVSPLKKQCDLIMYGNKLELVVEYTGNIALAKRYAGMKDIKGNAVFKDDIFEYEINPETGAKKVTKHEQKIENLSKDVVGAYAVYVKADGTFDTEIMNIDQIIKAWNQGAMKGNSPAHKNFTDQMAIKTVINRATKFLIRGSNDAVLMPTEIEEPNIDVAKEDLQEQTSSANTEYIDFETINEEESSKETSSKEQDEENQKLFNEALEEENKGKGNKQQPDF